MNQNNNLKCPNCGSMAISKMKLHTFGFLMIMCAFMVCPIALFIPFLLILVPVFGVIGIICVVLSPLANEYSCTCRSCKYNWKHNKNSKVNKEFEIGDEVLVFVNDKVKTGIIANIDTKRDDKYMVMFGDESLDNNYMYFTYDEMSLSLNE